MSSPRTATAVACAGARTDVAQGEELPWPLAFGAVGGALVLAVQVGVQRRSSREARVEIASAPRRGADGLTVELDVHPPAWPRSAWLLGGNTSDVELGCAPAAAVPEGRPRHGFPPLAASGRVGLDGLRRSRPLRIRLLSALPLGDRDPLTLVHAGVSVSPVELLA